MKKTVIFLLTAALAAAPCPAYAAETDSYGNVLDWDPNGSGDEDGAGEESAADDPEASETYSFSDQVDVIEQIQAASTATPEETGDVSFTLTVPTAEWSETPVRVEAYRGNVMELAILYPQNGFAARVTWPVGHYTFYRAYTGEAGEVFSADTGEFDVTTGQPVVLTLKYGDPDPSPEEVLRGNSADVPGDTETEESGPQRTGVLRVLAVIGVLAAAGIVAGVALGIRRARKKRKGYRNDLL